jgi:hypothetical protein
MPEREAADLSMLWSAVRDTRVVKLFSAGPMFTTPERTWNAEVCPALEEDY